MIKSFGMLGLFTVVIFGVTKSSHILGLRILGIKINIYYVVLSITSVILFLYLFDFI